MDNNLRMKEALFIFYPTNFGRYQLTCTHLKSYHMNQVFLFSFSFPKKSQSIKKKRFVHANLEQQCYQLAVCLWHYKTGNENMESLV
jgi:hypothetical protein